MLKKELKLVELVINPDKGSLVNAVALVEHPANEAKWISFSKNESMTFSADEVKHEIFAIALIPNQYIYRNSPELGEYACFFSKHTIREIAQVYAQKGFFNNMNLEHTPTPSDSYIFQSYLVDDSKGVKAPEGLSAIDGSWVIGLKVLSDSTWADITSNKVTGVSIEGLFEMIDTKQTVQLSNQKLLAELEKAFQELRELELLKDNIATF